MAIFDFLFGGGDDKDKQRERAARREARSAMELYKKQQAESEKLLGERKAQAALEKRVINEKQIRSLRAAYRRPGIMVGAGQAQSAPPPTPASMQPMEQSSAGT